MQSTFEETQRTNTLSRVISRLPIRYVFRRLLIAIPTMLMVITVAFFLMRAAPGNPYSADRKLTPEVEANMKASLGLDKPLHEQYLEYLGKAATGDLGPSMRNKDKTVSEIIADGMGVSLTVGASAMAVAMIFGSFFGVIAAIRQNSATDFTVMGVAMLGISIPAFVTLRAPRRRLWLSPEESFRCSWFLSCRLCPSTSRRRPACRRSAL